MINDSVLIVVDMLYDFIDGSLACANSGNAVANTLDFIKKTRDEDLPVLFIRDHHPANHSSFKENGGIWPVHCVAGTRGGEIHEDLRPYADEDLIFDKDAMPQWSNTQASTGSIPQDNPSERSCQCWSRTMCSSAESLPNSASGTPVRT